MFIIFESNSDFLWYLFGSLFTFFPKWLLFCQKPIEIQTQMSRFGMVQLSNGWSHSYSPYPLKIGPFVIQSLTILDFKCLGISNCQISDPHCLSRVECTKNILKNFLKISFQDPNSSSMHQLTMWREPGSIMVRLETGSTTSRVRVKSFCTTQSNPRTFTWPWVTSLPIEHCQSGWHLCLF